jgi:hypothetical protein
MDPDTFIRIPNTILNKKDFIHNVHTDKFLYHAATRRLYHTRSGAGHEAPAVYGIRHLAETRNGYTRAMFFGRPSPYSATGTRYIIPDKPIYSISEDRSISADQPNAHALQGLEGESNFLGQGLVLAIIEAGSTDCYERPPLSQPRNYFQLPEYSKTWKGQNHRSNAAHAHVEYMRPRLVAGNTGQCHNILKSPVPTRDAKVREYLRLQNSHGDHSLAQSRDHPRDGPSSAAGTSFEIRKRDKFRSDTDCQSNSFFASTSSGPSSKESDALGKLFENYRGPCNQRSNV